MNCQEIQNLLPGYWENLLSSEERSVIDSHLPLCPLCRRSLVDLKDTENLLKKLKEVEPPPFFEQRILSRVREEAGQKKGILQKLFFPIHIKIPIQAMATVLIAVLAVYIYQKNEPGMRPMASFSLPRSEQPQKGFQEAESPQSAKTPDSTNKVEPPKPRQSSTAPTPSIPNVGGAFTKKDQSQFAATPPAASRGGIGDSPELIRPKEDQNLAAEKAGTPIGTLRDKVDSVSKPVLSKSRVDEQETTQPIDASEREGKKKSEVADKGGAEKGALLRSAPTPASSVSAKTEQRIVIDLNLQVKDTNQAVRQIEERLNLMGVRIIEKMDNGGRVLIRAEMVAPKFDLLKHHLESIGRVVLDKNTLDVQEGRVIVLIHIVTFP
jgi:hypothetical protein